MDFFDLHCDTVTECYNAGRELYSNSFALSLEKGLSLKHWCQTFAIFIPDSLRGRKATHYYENVLRFFRDQLSKFKDSIRLCSDKCDILDTVDDGRCAAVLSVEGGAVLDGSSDRLYKLKSDGVKFMTLTWNGDNEIGCGVGGSGKGLTDFGRKTVRIMNELGIYADVSHLNEKGFWEVLELSDAPVIATHSDLSSVHEHKRNLTDEQFIAICRTGGIVGLNFYNKFLGSNGFDDLLRHIYRALELGGEDCIAFGSDFDGCDIDFELDSIDKMNNLYDYLVQHSINEEIIKKLCFNNALKLF